jgi:hypothetical protein
LAINLSYTDLATKGSVDLVVTGGVPPLGSFMIESNASGGSLGTASTCPAGATCAKYTAGPQGGDVSDIVSLKDSKGTTVTSELVVVGAVLAYQNSFADSNFGTINTDLSRDFTAKNVGSYGSSTGAISVTWTTAAEGMWSVVITNCDGAVLAVDQTCKVSVTFKGSSGDGTVGTTYTGTLLIQGTDGGRRSINLRGVKQ